MQRRYLITGVNGFTGRHLAMRLASQRNVVLLGTGRRSQSAAGVDEYCACDLTDRKRVAGMVDWARPDTVFHLAGLFGAGDREELMRVNVAGFGCLCEELMRHAAGRPIRLLAVGSAAEVGSSGAARLPVTENAPCDPETAYGQSKRELIRRALAGPAGSPLEIVAVRPFNLVGPGLDARTALGSFAHQLAAARRGEIAAIRCGALNTRRDYLDVRDAVEAYLFVAEQGIPGQLYNVCSGSSCRIGDLLKLMIDMAQVRVRVVESPPAGPTGLLDIYGDASKLIRLAGWRPTIPLATSLWQLLGFAGGRPSMVESRPHFQSAPSVESGQPGPQFIVPTGRN